MVSVSSLLAKEIAHLRPDPIEVATIQSATKRFVEALENALTESNINADVFIGGSFAKGTFMKSTNYDIDVFVRFDWKYTTISHELERVLTRLCKQKIWHMEAMHGSRDYFRVYVPEQSGYFEVIPVTRIKKPREERNITDLSYFHVPYVVKRIKGNQDQVRLAKQFFKAQRVYGAETYVRGFSGYTLELLIIHYKSFLRMIKALAKLDHTQRTVIDPAKHYSRKNDVFIQLNESKLHSPIILVDPTYKERNALAALSPHTFLRLQKSIRQFLAKPSLKSFEIQQPDPIAMQKHAMRKKWQFFSVTLSTDKQKGDIAGTKLKKFTEFLHRELQQYFIIKDADFFYSGAHVARAYFSLVPKKEVIRIGPPINMKKHVSRFKAEHTKTFVKNNLIHARIPTPTDARTYLHAWRTSHTYLLQQMHITALTVE